MFDRGNKARFESGQTSRFRLKLAGRNTRYTQVTACLPWRFAKSSRRAGTLQTYTYNPAGGDPKGIDVATSSPRQTSTGLSRPTGKKADKAS